MRRRNPPAARTGITKAYMYALQIRQTTLRWASDKQTTPQTLTYDMGVKWKSIGPGSIRPHISSTKYNILRTQNAQALFYVHRYRHAARSTLNRGNEPALFYVHRYAAHTSKARSSY